MTEHTTPDHTTLFYPTLPFRTLRHPTLPYTALHHPTFTFAHEVILARILRLTCILKLKALFTLARTLTFRFTLR